MWRHFSAFKEFSKVQEFSVSIFTILLTFINTLERQCPGANIKLLAFSGCEKWCYHIESQYEKLFSKCDGETVSMTSDGTTA